MPDIPATPTSLYLVGAGATIWIFQQVSAVVVKLYNKKNGKPPQAPCGCPHADSHTEALARLVKGVESMGKVIGELPHAFSRQRDAANALRVMCSTMEKQGTVLEEVAKQQAVLLDRFIRK